MSSKRVTYYRADLEDETGEVIILRKRVVSCPEGFAADEEIARAELATRTAADQEATVSQEPQENNDTGPAVEDEGEVEEVDNHFVKAEAAPVVTGADVAEGQDYSPASTSSDEVESSAPAQQGIADAVQGKLAMAGGDANIVYKGYLSLVPLSREEKAGVYPLKRIAAASGQNKPKTLRGLRQLAAVGLARVVHGHGTERWSVLVL